MNKAINDLEKEQQIRHDTLRPKKSQIQQEHNRVVIMVSKRPTRTQPICREVKEITLHPLGVSFIFYLLWHATTQSDK